ncbi:MAG: hypothetical protein ACP5I3_11595 [Thermoproteus sp.]
MAIVRGRLDGEVCNGTLPSSIYSLFITNGSSISIDGVRITLRRSGHFGIPSFGLAQPNRFFGFGPYYTVSINNTLFLNYRVGYTGDGGSYALYFVAISPRPRFIETNSSSFLYLLRMCGIKSVFMPFSVGLNDTNFAPRDQPYLSVFVNNFNALFPLSYGLVFGGILLWLYGRRRWS